LTLKRQKRPSLQKKKTQGEEERKALLKKVILELEKEFKDTSVEVYLIGSILQPFQFTARSDINMVLKNYNGDRFELWARLERKFDRAVLILSFESCHFQEFIVENSFKVVT